MHTYLTEYFSHNLKFLKSHVDFHEADAVDKMKKVLNSMDSEFKRTLK